MTDDQGWGDVAYNGHPDIKTPNLDDLAKSGLRFDSSTPQLLYALPPGAV